MKVVCPFTKLEPETWVALDAAEVTWEAHRLHDDEAYWRLLKRLWDAHETFCIVEHDIIVNATTITSMADCPQPWCQCAYPYQQGMYAGLGCVKFSGGFTASHPDVWDIVAEMSDDQHPPRHWCRLDGWLRRALPETACMHDPVGHVHDGHPAHRCI